jgi:hypothetical protein
VPWNLVGSAPARHRRGTALSAGSSAGSSASWAVVAATSPANASAKVREATAATSRLDPISLGIWPLALEWLPLGLGERALDPVGPLSRSLPRRAATWTCASRQVVSPPSHSDTEAAPTIADTHQRVARWGRDL